MSTHWGWTYHTRVRYTTGLNNWRSEYLLRGCCPSAIEGPSRRPHSKTKLAPTHPGRT